MKNILVVSLLLVGLASCKFAAKEIKKVAKITKAVKEACDCRSVDVSSDYDPSGANLSITIDDVEREDLAGLADSIVLKVKEVFPKLCNHEEVYVTFEGSDFDVEYTYIGCNLNPKVDTTFWDFDEFEDFEGEENEETSESSSNEEDVKGIEEMIEELEALKEKLEEEGK